MFVEKLAWLVVTLEPFARVFMLFLLSLYVAWFWKVGTYDGIMVTLTTLKNVFQQGVVLTYGVCLWAVVGVFRIIRVIFATLRDFFISRI